MQKIGIIGAGSIGQAHIRAVNELEITQLSAVAEKDSDRLKAVCSELSCDGYSEYEKLLDAPDIDIVVICLPHDRHCDATIAAFQAGKHVLVEKPMGVNVEQCDAMIAASKRANKYLSVGHMHHFSPPNRSVKKLLDEKAVGDLVCICDEGYRPFNPDRQPWYLDKRTHGGLWYQNGIHLIDRSCWWAGSRVVSVKALVDSRFFKFSADDVAMAMLQFENGVYSTLIHVWWRTRGTRFSTEFVCTDGMIQLRKGIESGIDDVFVGKNGDWEKIDVAESHNAMTRQLYEFVSAIDADRQPPVTAEYARHLVAVLDSCMESSRTGKQVDIS